MKQINFYLLTCLLLLCSLLNNNSLKAQAIDTLGNQLYLFKTSEDVMYKRAIQLFRGDTVVIQSDTAYIINALRYGLYEKSKNTVLDFNYGTIGNLIEQYEIRIEQCEATNDRLTGIINDGLTNSTLSIQRNMDKVNEIKVDLATSKKTLQNANELLEQAQKKLGKEKWLWGVSGVVIGVVAGIVTGIFL